MRAIIKNIEYDTDEENVELPTELKIELESHLTEIEDIEDFISDEISNITGFFHLKFNYFLESY